MSAFTALLRQSREYNAVCDALQNRRTPLGVLGLSGVHKAHWITALCESLARPALVPMGRQRLVLAMLRQCN